MLPPSTVPPTSGQHLPGGHGVTGDSVSIKDPFADEEQQRNYPPSGRYPPQGKSQIVTKILIKLF